MVVAPLVIGRCCHRLVPHRARPRLHAEVALLQRRRSSTRPALPAQNIAAVFAASRLDQTPSEETLTINGFVRSVRKQKRVCFAAIGDGSTTEPLQAVLTPSQAEGLTTGAAVQLTGVWKKSPGSKQSHELATTDVRLFGEADPTTYPLQKKYHSPEFLRTLPHLRSRLPFNALLLRLRSLCIARLTHFFAERDYVQTHPPIITSSDCEGAGEVFEVTTAAETAPIPSQPQTAGGADDGGSDSFFRAPKYLTVSTQLHLEALAQSVGNVWTLSPTFRAEKSDTTRHLSEFYMLEAELSFVERLDEVMNLVEDMIRDLVMGLQASTTGAEILAAPRLTEIGEPDDGAMREILGKRWAGIVKPSWPRITYTAAMKILQEAHAAGTVTFSFAPTWGDGLQTEHEKYLADAVGQGGPVFVTDYPRAVKPFYMALSDDSAHADGPPPGPTVACFDLLMPDICEVVGGSMREARLRELLEAMAASGLIKGPSPADRDEDLGTLKWYADLRRWGSVPHGGFGLGFDRLLGYLAGVPNIREVVAFPRWHGRCDC